MPTPRKRVRAPHPKENEPDVLATQFEGEEEDFELEDDESDEEDEEYDDVITVFFNERSIVRRFTAQQIVRSGGNLSRKFAPEVHGKKNWRNKACEFIETLMTIDENSTERPRFMRAEGLTEEETEALGLTKNGTPKNLQNGSPVPEKAVSKFATE